MFETTPSDGSSIFSDSTVTRTGIAGSRVSAPPSAALAGSAAGRRLSSEALARLGTGSNAGGGSAVAGSAAGSRRTASEAGRRSNASRLTGSVVPTSVRSGSRVAALEAELTEERRERESLRDDVSRASERLAALERLVGERATPAAE